MLAVLLYLAPLNATEQAELVRAVSVETVCQAYLSESDLDTFQQFKINATWQSQERRFFFAGVEDEAMKHAISYAEARRKVDYNYCKTELPKAFETARKLFNKLK